jgi:6-phosphogluconolactonase (cycloisomerase 2 family)
MQFLFVARSDEPLISAFTINSDGSLAPVPGAPFQIGAPTRSLATLHDMLIAHGQGTVIVYKVDKETGALQQMDSVESAMAELSSTRTAGSQTAVLDASGRFMYVADVDRRELLAYRVENGKPLALSSSAIPIAGATSSMAIVKP